jgi:hypothetical protein
MPEPGISARMAKVTKHPARAVASARPVENLIRVIRGEKVMLDIDLAALYGVSTKAFNQAIKRNAARFPEDFMFRLDQRLRRML